MVENLQKKGILSKANRKRCKEYEENIRKISRQIHTNVLSYSTGKEKYMISQMKNQLKKALVSEDDTMNYSYFEGKRLMR